MSDENFGFCPNCGHKLEEDSAYCPDCGAVLRPSGAYSAGAAPVTGPTGKAKPMDSQFLMCFILLAAFSAIMLLSAVSCLLFADTTVSLLISSLEQSGMTWADFMASMGLDMTPEELAGYMKIMGAAILVTAIPALISTVLCFMRRKHQLAVATAGLATLIVLVSSILAGSILSAVFETLVGAVVTYLLYKNCASYFED